MADQASVRSFLSRLRITAPTTLPTASATQYRAAWSTTGNTKMPPWGARRPQPKTMDFEQVDYWPELCEIMDFSETNVYSTLHVCWGAQAGLYYHYGVHKELLPEKMFGVFEHRVVRPSNPLVRGFDEVFYAPHSRHTGISCKDVDNCKALRILAESDVAGPFLMSTENGRQIFVTGHPEYDKYTLDSEYRRDVDKGLPIHVPVNYYPDDDPTKPPLFRWRAHAHLLYENWLNYYVYQNTPYDLGEIQRVKHE